MKNPIYAVNCKKCGGLLFGLTSVDDNDRAGPKAIVGIPDFRQRPEGNYFVCPHCGAKNMTVNLGGNPPQMKISHAF
jgi:hypothetical protein